MKIKGKGNKTRIVPISEQGDKLLHQYMDKTGLLNDWANEKPLFDNGQGGKLSRETIALTIRKYAIKARQRNSSIIPEGVSPHSMRHSKAMMLQEARLNLVYIRDFLGHSLVTTTALPVWQQNKGMLQWLESLGK